ncbi:DUF1428 domain-containing protein [Sandaracinobacteroides hominis]|uniref:DUF1428 domain-containing protein n=1 Tax=Sandaracinobacteroides hominis TaxID=2780086 RepID=UPI0018F48AD9|nr:DUF1428 domain-containing protein [Sandaracinobacteroides hominis]
MAYVEGFVIAVPTARKEDYRKLAESAAPLFKDFGALKIVECWGDDVPDGKITSFPMAVQKKDDETVVFSWIIWPDRETRKSGQEKMMKDERMAGLTDMPFDGKRMIFGGFDILVDA